MGGSYFEYKSCTNAFIDWIVKASKVFNESKSQIPNTLSAMKDCVEHITSIEALPVPVSSNILKVLEELPKALRAGSKAIQLRILVSNLYMEQHTDYNSTFDTDSNSRHQFAINILSLCHKNLSAWSLSLRLRNVANGNKDNIDSLSSIFSKLEFANKYDALSDMDDDIVNDISSTVDPEMDDQKNSNVAADDLLYDDLKVRVICFLIDMRLLSNKMKTVWRQIKVEEISIVAAISMYTIAFKLLESIYSELQLFYPSIQNSADFLITCLGPYFQSAKPSPLKTFYDQLLAHHNILNEFTNNLLRPNHSLRCINYNRFSHSKIALIEQYHELPLTYDNIKNFFFGELSILFTFTRPSGNRGKKEYETFYKNHPCTKIFFARYVEYFKTMNFDVLLVLSNAC